MNRCGESLVRLFRMLWEQHAAWTGLAIVSLVFDLPDQELTIQRLLRNPKDFAAVLAPLYGEEAALKFETLLTDHLSIAGQLVQEAKAGNSEAAAATEKRWYDNADEIAAFMAGINPYWPEEEWREMLHGHLALVKAEAVGLLTGNYADSIRAFDENEIQILEMADTMAYGILNQFM